MEDNLTRGPILKTLTKLAVPVMASSFLATFYNITDMAWIGLLGAKAVAGVGVGGMFTWLSQGLASMARMGGQVQVAQCIGRGDRENAHRFAQAAMQLALWTGLMYGILVALFSYPLVGFFHLEDAETMRAALDYTRIACGLVVFSFLSVTLTGVYMAQGDSKTPFVANLIGLAMNMILDPVFILGAGPVPGFGAAGAAMATVLAQVIVTGVMLLGVLVQKKDNVLKGLRWFAKVPGDCVEGICRIGIPTALQGMSYCFISIILTRMVAGFGPEAIATQRVGGQIESLSWNTSDGFGAALNAFIGQNYGAGKMERVKKGYRASLWTVSVWGLLITLIFVFLPAPIAGVFFHEERAVKTAVDYLIIVGLSEAFLCVEMMTAGALTGLGRTRLCSVISIGCTSLRIPLAILLSSGVLGVNGIWWALTTTTMLKGILFTCAFLLIARKLTDAQRPQAGAGM